ncbi:MAG: aminotransferase class I/II-fold pyridoxal phosphate-dependent enzyme [Trueperaceae bacterium]|nr:aminotransferase class I/II-fold pyridoxal phosphate-dependent enzyme [Trueperaceae bacterium]
MGDAPPPTAARRTEALFPSTIRGLTAYAHQRGAINMGQGSPDFPPPPEVVEAARQALADGVHQYVPTWGLPALRQALSEKAQRFQGLAYDPETETTVTCGVTEAVISALLAVVDAGDEVVILEPAHENYHAGVVFAGATPIFVPIRPPTHRVDPDELAAAMARPGVRAVIFNSPHNPSGRVFDEDELATLARLCTQHDVVAISDEIYEHMTYDGHAHVAIATHPGMKERTITISGLSKTYAATGWRVGWAYAPAALTDAIRKVHDFTTICAPSPLQQAAVTAARLPDAYYEELRAFYRARRDRTVGMLREAGFEATPPEGAYYLMAGMERLAERLGRDADDQAFAHYLIDEVGVGTVPGSSFYRSDPGLGRGLLRFAFPKSDATLDELERRLAVLR